MRILPFQLLSGGLALSPPLPTLCLLQGMSTISQPSIQRFALLFSLGKQESNKLPRPSYAKILHCCCGLASYLECLPVGMKKLVVLSRAWGPNNSTLLSQVSAISPEAS